MNHDRLRFDLADLADEVTPVDLRDRALRTSRRLGIQRAVATSATVLVMIAAATGTALAIRPDAQRPAPEPARPSATSTSPPAEATPAPTRSTGPSTSPTRPPSALTGTRYYLGTTGKQALIHAARGDVDTVTTRVPLGSGQCVANTITVSPDGRRLAWLRGDGDTGTLVTSRPDGSREKEHRAGFACLDPSALVWWGSDQLMALERRSRVSVDLTTGEFVDGDPGDEPAPTWSADGKWQAAMDDGKPYITGPMPKPRFYRYVPPADEAAKWDGWQVRSVSMDGRYVSIGWVSTDPSRRYDSFTVVDTTTSKVVTLPVSGPVKSVQFAADGTVLVRQATGITVLDASFQPVGEVAEAEDVQQLTLLTYVP